MAIREGAWDCSFCGATRNRGTEKFCGGCGSPRGSDVKFYLPEDARVVDDAQEIERARSGPDWTCAFCGGDNKGWNGFCTGCGSAREAGDARSIVEHAGEAPRSAEEAGRPAPPLPAPEPADPPRRSLWALGCLTGCGGLFLALLFLVGFLSCSSSQTLELTAAHWERTIALERQVTERRQAWSDQVPAGARELSRQRDVRTHRKVQVGSQTRTRTVDRRVQSGTEKVKVGTRDLGNGYFEDVYEDRPVYENVQEEETYREPVYRQQPVYDQRVTYEIPIWRESRRAQASGDDTSPRWPASDLAPGEREGARTEKYQLQLTARNGKVLQHSVADAATFQAFQIGRTYQAKVNRMGHVTELKP